jgi:hypothetical protein
MRLLLAAVTLHFDIGLCEESSNWANQEVYSLWEKHPLHVKLRSVERS